MASRIERIKSTLTAAQAQALCETWLKDGKMRGDKYVVCSPFRNENTPSFYVYFGDPIRFHDFGSGDHGDMIDLCVRLFNVPLRDALEAFEQMLGIESADSDHRPAKREGSVRANAG